MPRDKWGDSCIAYEEAFANYQVTELKVECFEDLYWLFTGEFMEGVFVPAEGRKSRGAIRMNYNEAKILYEVVQDSSGNVLEIGRRFGGSTVLLSVAAKERLVVSVDKSPAHKAVCEKYFQQCSPGLQLLIQDSRVSLETSFGCVLIDGDHSLEGVLTDTLVHWPNIEKEGIVVYHDAVPGEFGTYEAVTRVTDTLRELECVEVVSTVDSLLVLIKLNDLPNIFKEECCKAIYVSACGESADVHNSLNRRP